MSTTKTLQACLSNLYIPTISSRSMSDRSLKGTSMKVERSTGFKWFCVIARTMTAIDTFMNNGRNVWQIAERNIYECWKVLPDDFQICVTARWMIVDNFHGHWKKRRFPVVLDCKTNDLRTLEDTTYARLQTWCWMLLHQFILFLLWEFFPPSEHMLLTKPGTMYFFTNIQISTN